MPWMWMRWMFDCTGSMLQPSDVMYQYQWHFWDRLLYFGSQQSIWFSFIVWSSGEQNTSHSADSSSTPTKSNMWHRQTQIRIHSFHLRLVVAAVEVEEASAFPSKSNTLSSSLPSLHPFPSGTHPLIVASTAKYMQRHQIPFRQTEPPLSPYLVLHTHHQHYHSSHRCHR